MPAKDRGKKKKGWERKDSSHTPKTAKIRKSWEKNMWLHVYLHVWVNNLLLLPKWAANLKLLLDKEKEKGRRRPKSQSVTFSIENRNRWECHFLVSTPQAEELPLSLGFQGTLFDVSTPVSIPQQPKSQSELSRPWGCSSRSLIRKHTTTKKRAPLVTLVVWIQALKVHLVQIKSSHKWPWPGSKNPPNNRSLKDNLTKSEDVKRRIQWCSETFQPQKT